MVEAKVSKLKEYFTATTHHTETLPSDMSGQKLFEGNSRSKWAKRRDSPIRFNDTYRSNVVLGSDSNRKKTPSNLTPVRPINPPKCNETPKVGQGETGQQQSASRQRSSALSIVNVVID